MLTVNPITFIPVTTQALAGPPKKSRGSGNRRDNYKTELRDDVGDNLKHRSGDPDARMRYSINGYADIVKKHALKIVGWPSHIPFTHFSAIDGGIEPIKTLHTAWRKHTLYWERATPEDVANAERDPLSVHPNPGLIGRTAGGEDEGREAAGVDSGDDQAGGLVLLPLAHHPGTMDVLGALPTSTQPSVDLEDRERGQRSDTKRPHRRGGEEPVFKRARCGVKSSPYVLESDDDCDDALPAAKRTRPAYWFINDLLGDLQPAGPSRAEPSVAGSSSQGEHAQLASDFDDIESASGLSTREMSSEIEEY